MGHFDPPIACQVGVLPPREAGENYTPVGYRDKDVPYYGANTHMDGICSIFSGIPQDKSEVDGLTHDEKYRHYVNAGMDPRTGGKEPLNAGKTEMPRDGAPEPGRSCEVVGENGGVPLVSTSRTRNPPVVLVIFFCRASLRDGVVVAVQRPGVHAWYWFVHRVRLRMPERSDEGGLRADSRATWRAPLHGAGSPHLTSLFRHVLNS